MIAPGFPDKPSSSCTNPFKKKGIAKLIGMKPVARSKTLKKGQTFAHNIAHSGLDQTSLRVVIKEMLNCLILSLQKTQEDRALGSKNKDSHKVLVLPLNIRQIKCLTLGATLRYQRFSQPLQVSQ